MIPISLTIEGLYSYQHRQTLDFTNLTDAGLFGIFGEVGSGKSSILEAVTFALYGNSDRLGATNFAYNMMNLKSNRLYVEFIFSNHAGKTYKITREYKRNSRHFDKITNSGVALYEYQENQWMPLNSSNVEPIIGLSSENFRRTIIIPQGQFKEFIELKPTARTQMMKEIFNLHRFDLQDKVSALNSKNSDQLQQLEGKLTGFEEVSEEKIKELEQQASQHQQAHSLILQEYNEALAHFQHLNTLKSSFEELNIKQAAFDKLSLQKEETDKQKQQLDYYERVLNAFQSLLADQKRLESELLQKTAGLFKEREDFNIIDAEVNLLAVKIEKLKPVYESLPVKRQEENDLELIGEILDFSYQIQELNERSLRGKQKVEEVKTKQRTIREEISRLQEEIKILSAKRIDPQILLDVGNWFLKKQYIADSLNKQQYEMDQLQQKITGISLKLPVDCTNEKQTEEYFDSETSALEAARSILETEKNQLKVQWELSRYAHSMEDGSPCPLCGSLEHPHVLELNDVTKQLDAVEQAIASLDTRQKEVQHTYQETKMLLSQLEFIEKQLSEKQLEQKLTEEQTAQHLTLFVWKDFSEADASAFEIRKKEASSIEQQLNLKIQELEELRKVAETETEHLEKYTRALENFRLEEARKEIQIQQHKANLKILRFEEYSYQTSQEVRMQVTELRNHNLKTEQDYNSLSLKNNELNPRLAARRTAVTIAETQLTDINKQLSEVKGRIEGTLKSQNHGTLEEVYQILNLKLDTASERKAIERFTIEYETLKNAVEELRSKLKDVVFDETVYLDSKQKTEAMEEALNTATEKRTKTALELEQLYRAYNEKKELLKQREKLQKRADNLNTLKGLFTAAGFVQYVSSIYLKQLCENANVRFHRMTKNQLSLQINENNDFEIIDYLNEGKSRSVKTLSGGQLFQVSLSLALALAESVQLSVKSEKNFFFIDEGFGTQDPDSVNIVFETLLSLQKENRIVGIISHVEELKDRIPVSLTVVKDPENGSSFVQDNW